MIKNKLRYYLLACLIKTAAIWPDEIFLKIVFYLRMGYKLNLNNPRSYSEKLQWLKLHNRHPEYTQMVDKVAAKEYVASIIGNEYIIPTIAVYDSVEDIIWEDLPAQFVLKCSHDSGGIVICKDKEKLDIEKAKKKLARGLKQSYYHVNREYPYKDVPRKIICEEYREDESGYELKDYKWFCFDGKPQALFIASDRGSQTEETKFDFFDMDFNHLPFRNGHPNSSHEIKKPIGFEKMKELAAKLSQGIPQVRIDFYDINGHIYFGEITFFHWSGMMPFEPKEWDYTFGEWINLPKELKKDA